MFIQVSSNSFGQRVPDLAKTLQRPPNDYQRSDVGQRIDVAQCHGNLSQRIAMGQRADDSNLGLRPPYVGQLRFGNEVKKEDTCINESSSGAFSGFSC